MNKYYVKKNFDNDTITVTIKPNGYGKCYHEVKKDILNDIKQDILSYYQGGVFNLKEKSMIKDILLLLEKHYFK